MSRRSGIRRRRARLLVAILKEKGKLGELLECEPPHRAGCKIQSLISSVANEMAQESRDGNTEKETPT